LRHVAKRATINVGPYLNLSTNAYLCQAVPLKHRPAAMGLAFVPSHAAMAAPYRLRCPESGGAKSGHAKNNSAF
jgi:hypothetical protein